MLQPPQTHQVEDGLTDRDTEGESHPKQQQQLQAERRGSRLLLNRKRTGANLRRRHFKTLPDAELLANYFLRKELSLKKKLTKSYLMNSLLH